MVVIRNVTEVAYTPSHIPFVAFFVLISIFIFLFEKIDFVSLLSYREGISLLNVFWFFHFSSLK